MRRLRQYAITERATGDVTLVNCPVYLCASGQWSASYEDAARAAGHRYPADCDVRLVKRGRETPLPFDCIPLVLRKCH